MMAPKRNLGRLLKRGKTTPRNPQSPHKGKKSRGQQTVAGTNSATQAKVTKLGPILALAFVLFLTVGAGLGYASLTRPSETAVVQQVDEAQSSETQASEAFAANLVGAWLSATKDDTATLEAYMPEAVETVESDEAVKYRDLSVVSSQKTEQDTLSVVVSAAVKETEEVDGEKVDTWMPQYFQVGVSESDGRMAALGLPAPVEQPDAAKMPELAYPTEVESDDMKSTVTDFLTAYVTGDGDVTRFTSPDSDLTVIDSPPFDEIKLQELLTSGETANPNPDDGEETSVLANVTVATSAGDRTAQYALTLAPRDGRWEVKDIDPAPLTATD